MKIAIIGTRGIPNFYGGFEQFAEYLSVYLVNNNHDVYVYASKTHPNKEKTWNGVNIIHCYDYEKSLGSISQFFYDFNCILDSRKHKFDVILQLGYTSSSIWYFLLPKKPIIITNMDGLEWKRTKYNSLVQKFLHFAEKLAAKNSDYLIADSVGIQKYLYKRYNIKSTFIPYGANLFTKPDINVIKKFEILPQSYDLLIARIEPENNIEMILDGVAKSKSKRMFLVIGNNSTKFGTLLKSKFKNNSNIYFLGSIYDINVLNNLRHFSNLYFHGHTVGGTNPSLLEAMASNSLICAHRNIFNSSILGKDAYYFNEIADVTYAIDTYTKTSYSMPHILNNINKINGIYSWDNILKQYEEFIISKLPQ